MVKRSQSQSSNQRFDDNLSRFVPKPDERDIEYNNMQEAYRAKQVNKERKNKERLMSTPIEKGFRDKCAELGINANMMLKVARANPDVTTGSTFRTQGPANTAAPAGGGILDMLAGNPEIAGAGAGALLGAGAGAMTGKKRARNAFIGALSGAGIGAGVGAGFDPQVQKAVSGGLDRFSGLLGKKPAGAFQMKPSGGGSQRSLVGAGPVG